jgi:two-component system response regulator HydG
MVRADIPSTLAAMFLSPPLWRSVSSITRRSISAIGVPIGICRWPDAAGIAPPAGALVIPLGTPMDEVERLVIRRTLEQTRGDKNLAAQILGIAARTIYRKLDRDEEGRLLPDRDE